MNTIIFSILTDAFFIGLLIWSSMADLKNREIPNVAILICLFLGIVRIVADIWTGEAWYQHPLGALFALPFFFVWAKKKLFGGGDVKLMFSIGLYLGFVPTLIALVVSTVVCAGILIYLAVRRKALNVRVPLAPILSGGALVATLSSYFFAM